MLTPNQKKYLQTISEEKTITIQRFNPRVQEIALEIIQKIHSKYPDLQALSTGSSALGIAGQNDIDINMLSTPNEYKKYVLGLTDLFGEPIKQTPTLITWAFKKEGFEVELYLTDKNSPLLQEQIETFEKLLHNPDLQKEYEQIKLSCDGGPLREYMEKKYEFFNRILKHI